MIEDVPMPDVQPEQPPVAAEPAPELIDGAPGMEPYVAAAPSREPIVITNPGPQTLRTAIGSPYEQVAPGVLVDSRAPEAPIAPEAPVDETH